jgi:hypothetical protein
LLKQFKNVPVKAPTAKIKSPVNVLTRNGDILKIDYQEKGGGFSRMPGNIEIRIRLNRILMFSINCGLYVLSIQINVDELFGLN